MTIAEMEARLESGWETDDKRLLWRLRAAQPAELGILREIWEYLRISELMMLDTLNGRPENPSYAGKGCARFGHFLHCLHHPTLQLRSLVERNEIALAAWNLAAHASKPGSQIAAGGLEALAARVEDWPVVDQQGAIYGFGPHEVLDPGRSLALINLIISLFYKRHDFGGAPCVKTLVPGLDGKVRLGLLGDWGAEDEDAGCSVAGSTKKLLEAMNCDYLFHLGDACYAGSGGAPYLPAKAETNKLISLWPQHAGGGRSFILNSDHEMYSGGNGYFPVALGSEIFRHQNKTSYFALTFGKWLILGLDSAYHASAAALYTNGVLGEQQNAWIRELRRSMGGFDGKKILVLTHHEGLNLRGDRLAGLFKEVADAIGRAPDVWYWGHLRTGIAYSNASAAGRLGTRARCVGHSAAPFGFASGLMDSSGRYPVHSVDFFTRTSSHEGRKRVRNGFATLELGENGDIVELFFEQGKATPVWRSVNGVRFA